MSETEYPEEFDRLLDEAADLMEEGEFLAAMPLLVEASRLVPEDPEVWQRLGAAAFSQGEIETAETAYRKWWEVSPGNPLAFRALANLLFRLGQLEEAESVALTWLAREPDDPYAMLLIANVNAKLGEEYDSWLERAQEINPGLFAQVMTQVFDYSRGEGPGEWDSLQASEFLGLPETRVVERAARGSLPRYYNPETETFTFSPADFEARRSILERYGLSDDDAAEEAALEVDYAVDVDDLEDGAEVRVLLQKCPHCGEWTAGPLGDREKYFCCGAPMDPFIELSSEIEIQGRIIRKAGGGRPLAEGIKRLSESEIAELRELWEEGEEWVLRAQELLGDTEIEE